MANLNAPFGLKAVSNDTSGSSRQVHEFNTATGDSTPIFPGEPVTITGTADADGIPIVTRTTAGDGNAISGIVEEVAYDPDNLGDNYRAASTARKLFVNTDPNTRYIARVTGAFAVTDVGSNVNINYGTANTTWGRSGATLDMSTAGTGATKQFRVLRFLGRFSDNEIGSYALIEVKINNHNMAPNTAGV